MPSLLPSQMRQQDRELRSRTLNHDRFFPLSQIVQQVLFHMRVSSTKPFKAFPKTYWNSIFNDYIINISRVPSSPLSVTFC